MKSSVPGQPGTRIDPGQTILGKIEMSAQSPTTRPYAMSSPNRDRVNQDFITLRDRFSVFLQGQTPRSQEMPGTFCSMSFQTSRRLRRQVVLPWSLTPTSGVLIHIPSSRAIWQWTSERSWRSGRVLSPKYQPQSRAWRMRRCRPRSQAILHAARSQRRATWGIRAAPGRRERQYSRSRSTILMTCTLPTSPSPSTR